MRHQPSPRADGRQELGHRDALRLVEQPPLEPIDDCLRQSLGPWRSSINIADSAAGLQVKNLRREELVLAMISAERNVLVRIRLASEPTMWPGVIE